MPQPIRIVYAIPSLEDGGAERQLLELLRRLDRSRFEPSLVLLDGRRAQRASGLVVHVLDLAMPSGGNVRWLRRSLSFFTAVWRMRRCFRLWRTEMLHAFLPAPTILAGTAARMAGVPVIIAARRSLSAHYRPRGPAALFDRLATRAADWKVGNSNAVAEDICRDGCSPARVVTLYNGVDTEKFHPGRARDWRSQMGWSAENVVFGMIANFRACKRHLDFVEAFARVSTTNPNLRSFLAGNDSGTLAAVRRRIATLGLQSVCRIVENEVPPETMFAALDVFVSASDTEGFSNVVLEAMASGRPVIVTAVGGNMEAVVDGVSGILVPACAPDVLAVALTRLAGDAGLRASMGEQGRQRALQCFSIDTMVRAHVEFYLRAIATASARVPGSARAAAQS